MTDSRWARSSTTLGVRGERGGRLGWTHKVPGRHSRGSRRARGDEREKAVARPAPRPSPPAHSHNSGSAARAGSQTSLYLSRALSQDGSAAGKARTSASQLSTLLTSRAHTQRGKPHFSFTSHIHLVLPHPSMPLPARYTAPSRPPPRREEEEVGARVERARARRESEERLVLLGRRGDDPLLQDGVEQRQFPCA